MIKKFALYIFAAPLMFAACQSKCVEDLGIHTTRDQVVKPYDEIKVSGPIKLILRQDSSFKLNVAADSSVIDLVKTEVSGHELSVKLDPSKYCGKDSIMVTASIGDLRKITASEAVKIYSSSKINLNDITLKLSGVTAINLDLNAGKLTLDNDGSTNINLIGQSGTYDLTSKGTINMNAFDFVTGIYDINIEGTGKSRINVLNELKVKTSGATEIFYKGNPKKVDEKKTGIAKLEKVN